ncbi:MAG: protein kinase, partial [Candidatus Xenobia bacterium]
QVAVEWQIGDVVLNLYEVRSLLGEGGMGKVYRVHHRGWDVDLAVKSPRPEIFTQNEGQADFIREAETWVNLGLHTHIVSCYYVRALGGIPRVFIEYVEGGSLRDWIDEGHLYEGGPDRAMMRMLDIAIQFAWALQFAHDQNLIHQDVKPANVMLTPDGTAKVTDFGLARALKAAGEVEPNRSDEGDIAAPCTPEYASPEQMEGGRVSRQSDIWSYALSFLEMFAGQMPPMGPMATIFLESYMEYGATNPNIPRMPEQLMELMKRCFQVESRDRPASMREVAQVLIEAYELHTGMSYPRTEPKPANTRADALNNRAVSLMDLGRMEDALQLLEDAVKIDSQHMYANYNRGLLLWRSGRVTDEVLLGQLKELQTVYHDQWDIRYLIGWIHIERGDHEAAENALQDAQKLTKGNALANDLIGAALKNIEIGYRRIGQLEGHTDFVHAVCVRGDGRLAATASEDSTVRVWDVSNCKQFRMLKGHRDRVLAVSMAQEGRVVASGGDDMEVKVWDVESSRARSLPGHTGAVLGLSAGPTGRIVASSSADGTIRVWNLEMGQCLTLTGHTGGVRAVSVLPSETHLVSAGEDGRIFLWDIESGQFMLALDGHRGPVNGLALAEEGRILASCSDDKTLRLWDLMTAECIDVLEGHTGPVECIALTRDGLWGISGGQDKTIRVWELETGCCVRTIDAERSRIYSMALTPNGTHFIVASADQNLGVWELPAHLPAAHAMVVRPQSSEEMLSAGQGYGEALARARQAVEAKNWNEAVRAVTEARSFPGYERSSECLDLWKELATKAPRGSLRNVWPEATLEGHKGWVNALAMTPDAKTVVTGGEDTTLRIWDAQKMACVKVLEGHATPIADVAITADGILVASVARDGQLRIWDVETAATRATIERQGADLSLLPDGRFLASAGKDNNLRMFDAATGTVVRAFQQGLTPAMTPDGRVLVSATTDNSVKVWDVAGKRTAHILKGHADAVRAVAVTPDGRTVVTGSDDKTVRVWDVQSAKALKVLKGHTRAITRVAMNPDGRVVVSSSKDNTLRVWDSWTGECVGTLMGHGDMVSAVAISQDSRTVASSSRDGTLRLWHLDWDLVPQEPADFSEDIRPTLIAFMSYNTPYLSEDLQNEAAWMREGRPHWTTQQFYDLLAELGALGYGFLRPEGVYRELVKMLETWKAPPPV